jgi:ATP-binding cassette subfamily B protein
MQNKNPQTLGVMVKQLWFHINRKRRIQLGLLLVLMILASFAEVFSLAAILPFLGVITSPQNIFEQQYLQPFIRTFGWTKPEQLLLPITAFFIVAVIISGCMRVTLLCTQLKVAFGIGSDLSINIFRRSLFQSYDIHSERNSSELIVSVAERANQIISGIVTPIMMIISSLLIILTIVTALITIQPGITLITFSGLGSIYLLVILTTKKKLVRYGEQISKEQNQLVKTLQESFGGIRDVLIDGTQQVFCEIYRNADRPLKRAQANVHVISGAPRYGIEALSMAAMAIIALILATKPGGIALAMPMLGAIALGAQRLLPLLQQCYSNWSYIRGSQGALADALKLMDQPLPEWINLPLPTPIAFNRSIEIKNLSFKYPNQSNWILKAINLQINKGSRIGFIGTTGSGKSTLIDILMSLLTPTIGTLEVDGEIVSSENHRAWQLHIAHVPQSIFLADTTIAENIAFGVKPEQIDYERVKDAATRAQIAEAIDLMPLKYETVVGERGIRLSGGQRQRIGIARALYKNADVLIFDEATSALDSETEQSVMQAVASLSKDTTILIIAHRLSTLKNCTEIVELAKGEILRKGTYADIIEYLA